MGKTNLTDSIQFPHIELRLSQGTLRRLRTLRTPYLTKEQIEAKGWKFLHISQDLWFEKEGDFDFDNFYTSKLTMHYGAKAHIGYSDLRLTIIADDRGLEYKLFEGMCPSINEFRKITKLIRITM